MRLSHHEGVPYLVVPALPEASLAGQSQPELTGAGVVLRAWTDADIADLVCAYRDPAIQRWHCRTVDETEAAELISEWNQAWAAETGASWAVVDPASGALMGRAGFREIFIIDGLAEVAYWVLPNARRRRVAQASVRALSRWAFDDIGFHRLEILHSAQNDTSCRVAAATGFTFEGTLRSSVRHTDGWHDMHVHSLLNTD